MKKKISKIFTKKILLSIFLPFVVIALLYLGRSLIFAVWVNGKPVYRFSLIRELEKQGGNQVLAALIDQSLIASEARKSKITISSDEIETEIKNIETTVSGQGISLDEALNLRGMTRKDLENQIKTQKIVEKILSAKITITEAEAKDYFTQNKTLFGQNPVYDKVKEQVKNQLFQQKLSTEYTTWITDLKAKAKILYFINL